MLKDRSFKQNYGNSAIEGPSDYSKVVKDSQSFIEELKNFYSSKSDGFSFNKNNEDSVAEENEEVYTTRKPEKSKRKCQRCVKEEGVNICEQCQPLNFFCISCDSIVHSLISKREHTRLQIDFENSQTQKIVENEVAENISEKVIETQLNQSNSREEEKVAFKNLSFGNSKQVISSKHSPSDRYNNKLSRTESLSQMDKSDEKTSYYNKMLERTNSTEKHSSNLKGGTLPKNFSAEYINELNEIHSKEKAELEFKYNSKKDSLENIKAQYLEQIFQLQSNLDAATSKLDKEIQISKLKSEEINNQKLKIVSLESTVKNFEDKVEGILKEKKNLESKLESLGHDYKNSLKEKEREFKEQLDERIKSITVMSERRVRAIEDDNEKRFEAYSFTVRNKEEESHNEVLMLQNEVENMNEIIKKLETVLDEKENKIQLLSNNNSIIHGLSSQRVQELENKNASLTQENFQSKQTNQDLIDEIGDNEATISRLQRELSEMQQNSNNIVQDFRERERNLAAQINRLIDIKEQLQLDNKESIKASEVSQSELCELKHMFNSFLSKYNIIEKEHKDLTKENLQLKGKKRELEQEIRKLNILKSKLNEKCRSMTTGKTVSSRSKLRVEENIMFLKEDKESNLNTSTMSINNDTKSFITDLESNKKAFKEQQNEIQRLKQEIQSIKCESIRLDQHNKELLHKNNESSTAFSIDENSTKQIKDMKRLNGKIVVENEFLKSKVIELKAKLSQK